MRYARCRIDRSEFSQRLSEVAALSPTKPPLPPRHHQGNRWDVCFFLDGADEVPASEVHGRLRDNLVVESTQAIHHMQKALFEMNVQLSNVLSDITGESGLRIVDAILAGERDPEQLATLCSTRIKATRQTVTNALHGNWDEALLFCFKDGAGNLSLQPEQN